MMTTSQYHISELFVFRACCCVGQMPLMNGPDAARHLRAMGCTIPIIGLTGNVRQEDLDGFRSAGVNAAIPKPFSLERLFDVMEDIGIGSSIPGNNGLDVRKESEIPL
jgi:CheY-like chemotaxis protein